jgi:hypothetical protein
MRFTFRDAVFFIALLSTAMALGGALAHLFELPNKIGLAREAYFTVQQIYAGWDRLAYLLVVELVSMLTLAVLMWHYPRAFYAAAVAIFSLAGAQIVFWLFTYPANVATNNWTLVPADWDAWRRQWEFSHAVGALFQLGAMAALIVSVLARPVE